MAMGCYVVARIDSISGNGVLCSGKDRYNTVAMGCYVVARIDRIQWQWGVM